MGYVAPITRAQSFLVTESVWNADVVDNMIEAVIKTVNFPIDGAGFVLTTGIKYRVFIAQDCTIQQATLGADQSGSVVIDIWVDTHANFPPTDADSITASAPPTLTSAIKSQDGTLTGWTTSITGGSWLFLNIDSITTCTFVNLALKISLE